MSLTIEEKKARKAEYDRLRRLNNLDQHKARAAKYREENREAISAYNAARYASDPEKYSRAASKWRIENKEAAAAARKHWRAQNLDRSRAINARWRAANRDVARAASRAWSKRNRARIRDKARALRAKYPARYRGYVQKRRALTRIGSISRDLVQKLMKLQRGKCACCARRLVSFHMDHIESLSRGGAHADENIQLLCRPCNQSKSNKDPIEFMQSRGMLL